MTAFSLYHFDEDTVFERAAPETVRRGNTYQRAGRVVRVSIKRPDLAVCDVDGKSGDYVVTITVDQPTDTLAHTCTCPHAAGGAFCKHMVAATLELEEYVQAMEDEFGEDEDDEEVEYYLEVYGPDGSVHRESSRKASPLRLVGGPTPPGPPARAVPDWRQKLGSALTIMSHLAPLTKPRRYVGAIVLQRGRTDIHRYDSWNYGAEPYTLAPFIISSASWNRIPGDKPTSAGDINAYLEAEPQWLQFAERLFQQTNPAGCLNLDPDAAGVLNLVAGSMAMYGSRATNLSGLLSMLARSGVPVFLAESRSDRVECRLNIEPEPVILTVDLQASDEELTLHLGYVRNGAFQRLPTPLETITENPTWILDGERVLRIGDEQALSIASTFPLTVPAAQTAEFRESYFGAIAQMLPIHGDVVHWRDLKVTPVPRLYLQDDGARSLRAELRFAYGDFVLTDLKATFAVGTACVPDSWDLVRVHRQPEAEAQILKMLADPAHGLKRADAGARPGTYLLRARTHPLDFLLNAVPRLTQAGFEIYGAEDLKVGRVNRATANVRVSITSGLDWFDLETVVEFGDQQVSLQDVRKALKRGEHYVKLADGSVGRIPEEWLAKYRHLLDLAEESGPGLRLRDFHLPLLDQLLQEDAALRLPADLTRRRERLRDFEGIKPQPLSDAFTGELRPYQKHGYDWLHFLGECGFGGILADDMGLGKTVQVLAYLQARHEQPAVTSATLLVVPRSLITNWQLESAKFTPGLRFLDHTGGARAKDIAAFDGCDIVLTTYGTMLRDIEVLRGYTFSHIVLDESQAIKNPLAKGAKATRLLRGDQRLVMTGTPVENSTFELWSQFAFLNPGMLGGMEYFRREFANPIEANRDEQAAATLRRLVRPFIMRRTKEQVAPELPPRTERIVYTEMGTAQKKLYALTRERYRAELMGLIDGGGMNDARFRILEGLLRLRQIAIHPALMDRTYKGEAPKFEALLEILETLHSEGHKALIFSQFVETLKLVRTELDRLGMNYTYLDGKTRDRQATVDEFQNNAEIPVFLISLKAGGVGLNLTAADYVIHLDPWWNPAVEMQASDRAHRIGQDKPVFVYKIIARGTVEEKILELQERKRALVRSVIATEEGFLKSLTREDVSMLFG
jgi:non-specific serine/threonine protein kinase